MAELPAAIDALDRELKRDEEMSGHRLPEHTKIALLTTLFPEKDAPELKHRWIHNQKEFQRARADILAVAVAERLELHSRGVKDMEIDAVHAHEAAAPYPRSRAEMVPTEDETWTTKEWLEWTQEDEQIDYMANGKGKGKGRGKGGKGGNPWNGGGKGNTDGKGGKGDGKDGKGGKGKETRFCHWCKKQGHLKEVCRSFLAGKPKAISSFTEGWVEECSSCCDIDALSQSGETESEISDDENSGWATHAEDSNLDSNLRMPVRPLR
jgi:hypothetical protein